MPKHPHRYTRSAVAVVAVVAASLAFALAMPQATSHAQATKPATRAERSDKSDDDVPPFVASAIKVLTEEIESAIKSPGASKVREKSDYFEKSTQTIEEQALLKILAQRISRDARVDAYVKWQLLSLQKQPFKPENARAATQLYRRTQAPPAMPGTGNDGVMASEIVRVKKDDVPAADTQWRAKIDAHRAVVQPMIEYREDLYSRIPRTFELVRAAFEDAHSRMERGYPSNDFVTRVEADLRSLAAGSKPAEINQMIGLVQKFSGLTGNRFYKGVKLRGGDKPDKDNVIWDTEVPGFDKKRMEKLATDLRDMAKAGF
jgi:hypothetical protein